MVLPVSDSLSSSADAAGTFCSNGEFDRMLDKLSRELLLERQWGISDSGIDEDRNELSWESFVGLAISVSSAANSSLSSVKKPLPPKGIWSGPMGEAER